jgi:prevent-host-death family protein
MQTLTTMDLRKNMGEILDKIVKNNEPVMISRANKPLAVILSISEYEEKVHKKNRIQRLETISGAMDDWRKRNRKATSRVNVVKAVREGRDSR